MNIIYLLLFHMIKTEILLYNTSTKISNPVSLKYNDNEFLFSDFTNQKFLYDLRLNQKSNLNIGASLNNQPEASIMFFINEEPTYLLHLCY